jgi:FkbM family methyltransferase
MKGMKLYDTKSDNSELWMGQILALLFKFKKEAFIDVGVNIGQTLMQVKSLDKQRLYYGFEPNPSCNMFVEELIRINRFENVKLIPVGLFTSNTLLELDLYYDDITNSGGSVIKDYWAYNNKKPHRSIVVPLMDFDTINKHIQIKPFDIVKIDVEGAELEVLESLKPQINAYKPIIIIEILSAYSNENKLRIDRQNGILDLIKSLDYAIYRIIENESDQSLNELQEIEELDPSFNHNLCNYLFVHRADIKNIETHFKIQGKN